jgi:6-phosphogluconate dehydrogenase
MQLGFIGLGKMGGRMVERLVRQGGHEVIATDLSDVARTAAAAVGAQVVTSIAEVVAHLDAPRAIWVMVPSGEPTAAAFDELATLLSPGDVVVDGGNSRFSDSMERGARFAALGIEFCDAGTSGGVWGLTEGYCLMVGGSTAAFERIEPALSTLAPANGLLHVGPAGSGHYVKMIHNGIEYGMMQAYAEGFALLEGSTRFSDLDLAAIADLWNHGSVVRSWLLQLIGAALDDDPGLDQLQGWVDDSGEGRWTIEEAIDQSIPTPVLALSLLARFSSRGQAEFSNRLLAAMRNQFGGHAVKESGS